MRVQYKVFQSSMKSWKNLFDEAATFASEIGPRRLIGISHSEGRESVIAHGVVTVWYWDQEPKDPGNVAAEPDAAPDTGCM